MLPIPDARTGHNHGTKFRIKRKNPRSLCRINCSVMQAIGNKCFMKYAVVIEKTPSNYSGYVPDLPGCVATGATMDEIKKEIYAVINFHIEGMIEDGEVIPQPSGVVPSL